MFGRLHRHSFAAPLNFEWRGPRQSIPLPERLISPPIHLTIQPSISQTQTRPQGAARAACRGWGLLRGGLSPGLLGRPWGLPWDLGHRPGRGRRPRGLAARRLGQGRRGLVPGFAFDCHPQPEALVQAGRRRQWRRRRRRRRRRWQRCRRRGQRSVWSRRARGLSWLSCHLFVAPRNVVALWGGPRRGLGPGAPGCLTDRHFESRAAAQLGRK